MNANKTLTRFQSYTWGVLIYNLLVILWGVYVRATGSGAGCGSHWPTCNGEVIPRAPQAETIIEFVHRLTSGVAFLLVLVLLVWAFRIYPKGHRVRKAAGFSMAFIISESLVGAGLVLFGLVGDDASITRVVVMGIHLLNTHMLLAGLVLTAWWAAGKPPVKFKSQPASLKLWLGIAIVTMLVLSMAGAITALGDTLFPSETLVEGFRQDLDPTSHFLIRLRFWHPVIAVALGLYLVYLAGRLAKMLGGQDVKRFAIALGVLFGIQLVAGMVNLLLLAPVWMQIVHLLLADLVWLALVLLTASVLKDPAYNQVS
ncbi:MAG: COX15/CtaA family protein [Anaerolineales bacterium]|nr:COX15/CtaA family protein [Anaerolineales bacterium]